jgi:arginyl-tRNA synthetase
VIAAELRRAILAAAGVPLDPLLRPGPEPGTYASSLPLRLAPADPRPLAVAIAARLSAEPWIAQAQVTGVGHLTVAVTVQALAGLAVRIPRAGAACAASDALAGRTLPAPPCPDLAAAPDWPAARAALAAQLTARLAAAAGATLIFDYPERASVSLATASSPPPASRATARSDQEKEAEPAPVASGRGGAQPAAAGPVARAIWYAGEDAVRFALARMPPGGAAPDAAAVARHVPGNPAYAVRYAHAAAAAVLRWASHSGTRPAEIRTDLEPGELALLDGLSWLPERVAAAARRGRPDEFARYLEGLAVRGKLRASAVKDCGWRTPRGPGSPPGSACLASMRPNASEKGSA